MAAWTKPGIDPAAPLSPPPVTLAWGATATDGRTDFGLAADPTEAIYSRFCQLLRGRLAACTVTDWTDPGAIAEAGTDGPPWVRLTPHPGTAEPVCYDGELGGMVCKIPLMIGVETSTAGPDPRDSMRLWGAIQKAVFPLDPELVALGVGQITPGLPAWGSAAEAHPQTRCVGRGTYDLTIYYLTPEA